MADKTIDASRVDVDVSDESRTITLKGTVDTAWQKAKAEAIAREKANGYTVANRLEVRNTPRTD